MSESIRWHSENAFDFDSKYRSSHAFVERLAIWDSLMNTYVRSDLEVLDVGCGGGVITAMAARRARKVFGFDGSAEMVALAEARRHRERLENITFRVGTIDHDSWLSSSRFDVILCSSVLEYVDDYWRAIEQFRTALAPAGILIFSMPNGASIYRRAERAVYRIARRPAYYAYVRNLVTIDNVCVGLRTRSLEPLEVRYYASVPVLSTIVRAFGRPDLADNLFVIVCQNKR
jgi:2-polyprenyl-3-methyl-5-hydroxy-6-metoxy-1,4-benzoquinol methylase